MVSHTGRSLQLECGFEWRSVAGADHDAVATRVLTDEPDHTFGELPRGTGAHPDKGTVTRPLAAVGAPSGGRQQSLHLLEVSVAVRADVRGRLDADLAATLLQQTEDAPPTAGPCLERLEQAHRLVHGLGGCYEFALDTCDAIADPVWQPVSSERLDLREGG